MSNGMKLIMENWRSKCLMEQVVEPIKTYGDLRNQLNTAIKSKKKEAMKGFGIGLVFDALGGAIFKDTATFIKTMYNLPDDKKTNTVLDVFLNVDDDVSAIVDDNLENAFLQDFLKEIQGKDDNEEIKDSVTELLQRWIAAEFNEKTVTGVQE
jgi:LDH2 family malate/lactate/ureidoglycolate dehydrogenase